MHELHGMVQVLFKMDKAGEGQEVIAADLAQNRDPSFIGFTHQMFLEVCLPAGHMQSPPAFCSLAEFSDVQFSVFVFSPTQNVFRFKGGSRSAASII